MQTPYEVVKNSIHFNDPDRLPVEFRIFNDCDTHMAKWNQTGTGNKKMKETYDEWGCRWQRSGVKNMGQVTGHPLLEWNNIDLFRWPDPDNKAYYEGMEQRFENSSGKYIKTDIFMLLFERMHALRGFENVLTDLYLERENIEMLADKIVEYDVRIIENISKAFPGIIHGLSFTDDWGTEQATFISVKLFDEFFKPRYKKIFDAAKKAGWDLWMHSCGKINEIIPSLIDVGVDVLNMQQPITNGIAEIGNRFAGKVCFSTVCDIQKTLPFKSNEEIENEALDLVQQWGTDKGGLIISDYGDGAAIGVTLEKKRIMYDKFKTCDRWKK